MPDRIPFQRLGGLALSATHDPLEYTAAARQVFKDSFLEKVDPDGSLRKRNPREAARRAEAARKLHYASLAYKSVAARRRKEKKNGAVDDQRRRREVRNAATTAQRASG
jgi:hypothetical protein